MNQATQKNIVLYYLHNLLSRPVYGELETRLCDWFENSSHELTGKDVKWQDTRYPEAAYSSFPPKTAQTIRSLLKERPGKLTVSPEIKAIIEAFHLTPEYHDALALWVYIACIPMLGNLYDACGHQNINFRSLMSGLAGVTTSRYDKILSPCGEFAEKGFFTCGSRWYTAYSIPDMTAMFLEIILEHCRTATAVKQTVLGKRQKATLRPEHFEYIQTEYGWMKTLLANALGKTQRGVNILIYGKPGTGKTELAKTLCQEIGASLFDVSGDRHTERNGIDRRADLSAACCVTRGDRNSVLMMDEAEDVFDVSGAGGFLGLTLGEAKTSDRKSKLFLNRLLENNPVPIIWVANSIHGVDPAHIRRFSYALRMESPNDVAQERIWKYSASKHRVRLPEEEIKRLAKAYDIAPAVIDTSLRTAALTGDHDAVEKTLEALQTAMYGHFTKREFADECEFSPELLNTDMDLAELAQQILTLPDVNFSLCLYGIPGSGKSAYARYLASRLKMKVLHKRASDLLSRWVGGTEEEIAAAFAEARKKKMLLVIDEADSFLRDRRGAERSWEVTQVNEMLTQMESHPLPFVCTTNLMEGLDRASLRRFTFKVKYDYLTRNQVALAFRRFFGAEPTALLNSLNCLTPGDFAVVARKARICGTTDHRELVKMLRGEQEVKNCKTAAIGFER